MGLGVGADWEMFRSFLWAFVSSQVLGMSLEPQQPEADTHSRKARVQKLWNGSLEERAVVKEDEKLYQVTLLW